MAAVLYPSVSMPMPPRARPAFRAPQGTAAPASAPARVRTSWLERLALWADAQPPHRRLGSWTLMR